MSQKNKTELYWIMHDIMMQYQCINMLWKKYVSFIVNYNNMFDTTLKCCLRLQYFESYNL